MKAQELRIGNYVDDVLGDFEAQKIGGIQTTIYDNEWCEVCINWNGADECLRKLHEIKPIPLTEEWLVRLGLHQMESWCGNDGDWYRSFSNPETNHKFGVDLNTRTNDCEFNYDHGGLGETEVIIHYVHQLQNLYFALTGEELKMKA